MLARSSRFEPTGTAIDYFSTWFILISPSMHTSFLFILHNHRPLIPLLSLIFCSPEATFPPLDSIILRLRPLTINITLLPFTPSHTPSASFARTPSHPFPHPTAKGLLPGARHRLFSKRASSASPAPRLGCSPNGRLGT